MRILLIILQTAAFLALLAAVLVSLYFLAHAGRPHEPQPVESVLMFMFGSWLFDGLIFIVLAAVNIWFVLGPLMKVEDPVRRTLQHLSVINIQIFLLFAMTAIAAFLMSFPAL